MIAFIDLLGVGVGVLVLQRHRSTHAHADQRRIHQVEHVGAAVPSGATPSRCPTGRSGITGALAERGETGGAPAAP